MPYVLMFMMGSFAICGGLLIWIGIRGCWSAIAHAEDYEKAVGSIIRLERRESHFSHRTGRRQSRYANYPVVQFTTSSGELVEFQSEVGDGSQPPRFQVGQSINVLYDPYGDLKPILDTWFSQ